MTRRLIKTLFVPLTNILLPTLTPQTVLSWHASLRHIPNHANRALGVLRAMIRWGVRLHLCSTDPTIGIQRYPTQPRARYLSMTELSTLLHVLHRKTTPSKVKAYVILLLGTGCRRAEAQTLRWTDLNLDARRWIKPRTKSGRWHIVPLPLQVIDALRSLPRLDQWVFPGQNGKPWSLSAIEKAWGKIRSQARIPDVRLHDLRRTAASYLAIHGENLSTIQHMLDHSSLQPTAIYARLNVETLERALQANADRMFGLTSRGGLPSAAEQSGCP